MVERNLTTKLDNTRRADEELQPGMSRLTRSDDSERRFVDAELVPGKPSAGTVTRLAL